MGGFIYGFHFACFRGMVSIRNSCGFGENMAYYFIIDFFIKFQCFASIRLNLWASSQKCVTKTYCLGFYPNRI